jgi:L-lactate dehydrogenase (cytochrome)
VRVTEAKQLVWPRRIRLRPADRALATCHDTTDWRAAAARVLPRGVFDFIDGGAEDEVTLAANRAAFRSQRWVPRALVDVSVVDSSCEMFGERFVAPLGLAPVGGARFVHPDGEVAVARASAAAGLPYVLSSMANTSVEAVAATGARSLWFQLYFQKDRGFSRAIVDRAAAAGYRVLEVTVDNAVAGRRMRELRSGMTLPPQLSWSTALDLALHARYWGRMLRTDAPGFPNWIPESVYRQTTALASAGWAFDSAVTWSDIAELRERWEGPLLLKGLFSARDVLKARDVGVDGVHLSNHGGRQLDRSATPLHLLPAARRAAGDDLAIVLDSGIRDGGDVAIAIALGADLCFVGRAYLYPLAAAGEAGVRCVLGQLAEQFRQTMALVGVSSAAELRAVGSDVLVAAGL